MKIYFAWSIRAGRQDRDIYLAMIKHIQQYGTVLTEHLGDPNLTSGWEQISDQAIYERDLARVKESDVIVAEVSNPSLGVGYELWVAEMLWKSILCLYGEGSERQLSAMVRGNHKLSVGNYKSLDDAKELIDSFFQSNLLG